MIVYGNKANKALLNMVIQKSTKVKSFLLKQGNTEYKFVYREDKENFLITSGLSFKTTMRLEVFKSLINKCNFRYVDINIKPVVNK